MLLRFLIATGVAAVAGVTLATSATADPAPEPTIPNVNAYMPVNPANYTTNHGRWFAFAGPPGVVCILDNLNGDYGCAGALPGAPDGANVVSAGPVGAPSFSKADVAIYAAAGDVKPLPPKTRISYRQVSCGVDDTGVVACLNSRDQVGFVIGPTGTFIDATNELVDRPDSSKPPVPTLPPG